MRARTYLAIREGFLKILGIDLGTSNTYLYLGSPDANGHGLPKPLTAPPESDSRGSFATAVLYENDAPIAIGNVAEAEYNVHGDQGGVRYLATQFKPEIAKLDSPAQKWMRDFLAGLKKRLPRDLFSGDLKIFVGVPSLAREDFSLNLARCFTEAGWPRPESVRESDAAVVSCLQAGTLSIEDMERKCLILDFGGGTCDYTAIEGLDALQNGGDILYGGRLFDDLVFQRFLKEDAFAKAISASPVAWYVHWVECRKQKEDFSEFINRKAAAENDIENISFPMRLGWISAAGKREEAYVEYDFATFLRDAENYQATSELLATLAQYKGRGGISAEGLDLLEGKQVGLISWLKKVLETVDKKNQVRKIVLTGGSSRWHFTRELCARLFPQADCLESERGYEDIAFGLALFPVLLESREKARKLLERNLPAFTSQAINRANDLIAAQTADMADLCAAHIVDRDILPCLENAANLTVGSLEEKIRASMLADADLMEIVHRKSAVLNQRIQEELEREFRLWLRENGVPLTPVFKFPGKAISNDFLVRASSCLSNLDIVKLTRLAITAILPLVVGGAAAHFLAPVGEPVSIGVGIGLAGAAAWLFSKTAPQMLEKSKIPAFLLNEKNRGKIVEKIHAYIRKELENDFTAAQSGIAADVEKRLTAALEGMVNSLNVLNQIRANPN